MILKASVSVSRVATKVRVHACKSQRDCFQRVFKGQLGSYKLTVSTAASRFAGWSVVGRTQLFAHAVSCSQLFALHISQIGSARSAMCSARCILVLKQFGIPAPTALRRFRTCRADECGTIRIFKAIKPIQFVPTPATFGPIFHSSVLSREYTMSVFVMLILAVILVVGFSLIMATIRIVRQYERAVVFTLGKFQGVKGPGLVLMIPFIQEMVRVDLRIQVIEIPTQDVISRDNVSMKVDAVLYFNVVDPERAIIQVQSYLPATVMLAQTTLRAVLGQHELDEMLSERKKLSADVQNILDSQTEIWGIKVTNVEIRTVELTDNMVRAIAKQAEAERDRRAKVIHAEAEFQASQTLVNAAKILSSVPAAMQLRYLQTLTEIGAEQNSTVVFPMPIDIIKPFLELFNKSETEKTTGAP
jgi:regulator of protease activity HflC (stomatin/prohibitin superfamily)